MAIEVGLCRLHEPMAVFTDAGTQRIASAVLVVDVDFGGDWDRTRVGWDWVVDIFTDNTSYSSISFLTKHQLPVGSHS